MNTTNQDSENGDIIFALQQRNLIYNYNFLYFSNKDSEVFNHPDGWVYTDEGSGGSITSEAEMCKIFTGSNASMTFKQALHEFPRWRTALLGKTVTVQANVILKKGCQVTLSLYDGLYSNSKTITADSQKEYILNFDLDVSTKATELSFQVETKTNNSFISIGKVFANVGKVAVEGLPCMVNGVIGQRHSYIATETPPAEELSLCDEIIELDTNKTRLSSVLNLRFGQGANKLSNLPDVRGLFTRAWNHGTNIDTDAKDREMLGDSSVIGDYVGTSEGDIFKEHLHQLEFKPAALTVAQGSPSFGLNMGAESPTKKTGEGETRPKNFAELYTIKWA